MNEMVKGLMSFGIGMMKDMEAQTERRKEEILREWNKTFDMPRKMKKQRRKELNLDWAIVNWNPMGDIHSSDFETFFN